MSKYYKNNKRLKTNCKAPNSSSIVIVCFRETYFGRLSLENNITGI